MPVEIEFEAVLEAVRDEVARVAARRPRSVGETINFDFGVVGADGDDLIAALVRRFDIHNLNFDFDRYFGDESPRLRDIWKIKKKKKRLAPLTVEELARQIFESTRRRT